MESCSTCAKLLSSAPPYSSDKAVPEDRLVECCARVICGPCIQKNQRFATYCPYCQVSSGPSPLPQGLRDPPSYTSIPVSKADLTSSGAPPPYSPSKASSQDHANNEKAAEEQTPDTLHFLNHDHDTMTSLSLAYGVPAAALRRANNITSDHLLLARRTILIPAEFYKGGVSLSPRPLGGEEEELRKSKIRRFMTSTKVSDYDIALLYLQQSGYDLRAAVDAYFADEAWERDHPTRRMRRPVGRGLAR